MSQEAVQSHGADAPAVPRSLSAEEWNGLLEAEIGSNVVELFEGLRSHPPRLQLPQGDLQELVLELEFLYPPHPKRLVTVSVEQFDCAVRELMSVLPPEMNESVDEYLMLGLSRNYQGDLTSVYQVLPGSNASRWRLGPERERRVRRAVTDALTGTEWETFAGCFDLPRRPLWVLASWAREQFWGLVFRYVTILAVESDEAAQTRELLASHLDWFRKGNFPVGKIQGTEEEVHQPPILVLTR